MIKANFKSYATYTTDEVYQWDINQYLNVTGLNLSTAPEVHFENANVDRAIVRQAVLENHVVSVKIPNSLLQDPLMIKAHIGIYEDETFKVVETVEIPVKPRKRPFDYQITDDDEVYSFKAIENKLADKATNTRVDNIIAHNNDTDGNSELIDLRTDINGKVHGSAGAATRSQINELTRGRSALASLLPSSIGNYPRISTTDRTFTIDGDTLIIHDRLKDGWVSLSENNANCTVTWGSEITSSAICFYYDISNQKLVAHAYNDYIDAYNYILLATLRIGHGSTTGKAWANCSCPIYVDGYLSTEVNCIGGFAAMLPPMRDETQYPRFSTEDNTLIVPEDTLLVDPRLENGFVSLQTANNNCTVSFGELITSAVCIYYEIATNKLIAKPYNIRVNFYDYLLVCTIRKKAATDPNVKPMAWASCPILIDDRLSTEKKRPYNAYGGYTTRAINHRGYNIEAPENTLSAYKLSAKKGFTHVECDVSFTSDGYAVLLHDSTVDRTSNGSGSISQLTLDEVRALDFGSWKSEKYTGEKIPRFEEFILLCKQLDLHPYIELKEGTEAQIKALVDVVKRFGMKGKVTWISFNQTYLTYIKAVDPKARLGYVVSEITETTISTVTQSLVTEQNDVFINCAYGNVTDNAIELCINADIPLEVWTVNSETDFLGIHNYVTGFTSDSLIVSEVLYNNYID